MNLSKCIGIVGGVIGAFVLLGFLAYVATPPTTDEAEDKSREPRHAYVAAREFCKENLKSPRSAKFSSGRRGDDGDFNLVAVEKWDGMWYAGGVVDAQNSFGGLMRDEWDAYVQQVPQGWKLVYLRIGEQTVGQIPSRPKSATQLEAERQREQQRLDREAAARREVQQKRETAAEQKRIETTRKVVEFQLQRAKDGSAQAQYDLAIRYLNGDGVERDVETAIGWLRVAARQNHSPSIAKLQEIERDEGIAQK